MQRWARMCGVLLAVIALAAGCSGSEDDEPAVARDEFWVADRNNCSPTGNARVFICSPRAVDVTGAGLIYHLDALRNQKVFITNIGRSEVGVRSAQGLAHPTPVRLRQDQSWTLERIDAFSPTYFTEIAFCDGPSDCRVRVEVLRP